MLVLRETLFLDRSCGFNKRTLDVFQRALDQKPNLLRAFIRPLAVDQTRGNFKAFYGLYWSEQIVTAHESGLSLTPRFHPVNQHELRSAAC